MINLYDAQSFQNLNIDEIANLDGEIIRYYFNIDIR